MNQNQRALPALVSQGLTLADCFAAFASDDPVDVAAHEVAAASIDRDDSLELERHVVVSVSDRGRWLASWRWVPDADLPRKAEDLPEAIASVFALGVDAYLRQIRRIREAVSVPVIAPVVGSRRKFSAFTLCTRMRSATGLKSKPTAFPVTSDES